MYKVLTEYAKAFGEDFPISKMPGYSAYEIRRKAQECLDANKKYSELTATSAATASTSK
ncbi:hypothetical protein [Mitsuokella jalaludinii]|jgi:hypothetical protein|uniref:hypothetical protein n=1 Tax=Mitsuokella jalaludinii TaxID=187979 RepID=UPI001D005ACE|nr:hypothetical protein [Mitsuokella jalaludinii]MCB5725284.1 hypothetical protein [Mitsuokella jalaludinii]